MSNVAIVSKITVKAIHGKVEKPTERTILMRVVGIASEYQLKVHPTYEDSYVFKGDFQATNVKGEKFRAASCYLPRIAENLVLAAMRTGVNTDDPTVRTVEFGFDIGIVPSDNLEGKGYNYFVEPLIVAENDRLSALLENINNPQPKLDAPIACPVIELAAPKKVGGRGK